LGIHGADIEDDGDPSRDTFLGEGEDLLRLALERARVRFVWFAGALMLVAGFAFSAVAGYMAGLVGSSNNPISGVTITTIVFSAFFLMLLIGKGAPIGPAAAIVIGAVAAVTASDTRRSLSPRRRLLRLSVALIPDRTTNIPAKKCSAVVQANVDRSVEKPRNLLTPRNSPRSKRRWYPTIRTIFINNDAVFRDFLRSTR
jgi:uncharacterized membrane protein (DUF485 family)